MIVAMQPSTAQTAGIIGSDNIIIQIAGADGPALKLARHARPQATEELHLLDPFYRSIDLVAREIGNTIIQKVKR